MVDLPLASDLSFYGLVESTSGRLWLIHRLVIITLGLSSCKDTHSNLLCWIYKYLIDFRRYFTPSGGEVEKTLRCTHVHMHTIQELIEVVTQSQYCQEVSPHMTRIFAGMF